MSLLWTIVPMDSVFHGYEHNQSLNLQELKLGEVTMVVLPAKNGMGVVQRLISPNPQDYLREEWRPGALVPMYRPR